MFDRQSLLFRDIQSRGVIKPSDVLRLRRDYFAGGPIAEGEAQALLLLNASCPIQDTAWSAFLAEQLSAYLIHIAPPHGYVTAGNARWLISHTSEHGRIERLSCFDLVVTVLENARWSPPSLSAFALRQIELAIVAGTGPLRRGSTSPKGSVGSAEVALIRRILAAGQRAGGAGLTLAEAEVLLDIHDATLAADNCAAWTEFMSKALANLFMTASGYAPPPRDEALQPEAWTAAPAAPIGGNLQQLASQGVRSILGAYGERTLEQQALAHLDHQKLEIITAEPIAQLEPAWLAKRMYRAGSLAPAEAVVLACLRQQQRRLHPALQPLLDRAA